MKFLSDIRLLILAIWLGAIFFIAVAQSSFAVLPTRELAGSVVNRTLAILNYGGLAISVLLILTSLLGASRVNRLWLWVEESFSRFSCGHVRRWTICDRLLADVDTH